MKNPSKAQIRNAIYAAAEFNQRIQKETTRAKRGRNTALLEALPKKIDLNDLDRQLKMGELSAGAVTERTRFMNRFARQDKIQVTTVGEIPITKFEANYIKTATQRINKQREAARKALGIDITVGQMGALEDLKYKEKKVPKFKTRKGFESFFAQLTKQAESNFITDEQIKYKENLRKAIINNLGTYADNILKFFDEISPDALIKKYAKSMETTFELVYGAVNVEQKAAAILSEFRDEGLINETDDEYAMVEDWVNEDMDIFELPD